MLNKELKEKANRIIAEQLGIDASDIRADALIIEDYGADSLDQVELVMAFEETFGCELRDEDAETLKSVQDIYNYIEKIHTQGYKARPIDPEYSTVCVSDQDDINGFKDICMSNGEFNTTVFILSKQEIKKINSVKSLLDTLLVNMHIK